MRLIFYKRAIAAERNAIRVAGIFSRCALLVISVAILGWGQTPARKAQLPKEIAAVLEAPGTPDVQLSPANNYLLVATKPRYYSLEELARPKRGLAGIPIDPQNNGRHAAPYWTNLEIQYFDPHNCCVITTKTVSLPPEAKISSPVISADGKLFAFTLRKTNHIELWIGDAATTEVWPVPGLRVNEVFEGAVQWMPDQRTLLVRSVPAQRGPAPDATQLRQPQIQENLSPTDYALAPDLLTDEKDAEAFGFYATSQLVLADAMAGHCRLLGEPAIWEDVNPSPDGKYFWTRCLRKFPPSRKPYPEFLVEITLWESNGKFVRTLMRRGSDDKVPVDGVRAGPRAFSWRDTAPATLVWVEALDGGDPYRAAALRDKVVMQDAPFSGPVTEIARLKNRFDNIYWGAQGDIVLINELIPPDNTEELNVFSCGASSIRPFRLTKRNANGSALPVLQQLPNGAVVVAQQGDSFYLTGKETVKGREIPYLDRVSLSTQHSQRLFSSDPDNYEEFGVLLSNDGKNIITRRESPSEPRNYYWRKLAVNGTTDTDMRRLTNFAAPVPEMSGVQRELIKYRRSDGVELSAVLYLPPGYEPGQSPRLPTVISVYPEEYEDGARPEANTTPVRQFVDVQGLSPLFFALHGYAVLEEVAMPVLGRKGRANDGFVRQTIQDAEAAINKVVAMGVTDPDRVGVWGHSYGAFTVGNLLAHSDLFRAGIASSGAYNRTLTPFGFQTETRRLWEVPEFYRRISPYFFADRIKEPLLLLHGNDDEHGNTPPQQSKLMAEAIWGNKGTARLVLLPYEGHQYLARESVSRGVAEMFQWFDAHVKNAAPRRAGPVRNEKVKGNERRKNH